MSPKKSSFFYALLNLGPCNCPKGRIQTCLFFSSSLEQIIQEYSFKGHARICSLSTQYAYMDVLPKRKRYIGEVLQWTVFLFIKNNILCFFKILMSMYIFILTCSLPLGGRTSTTFLACSALYGVGKDTISRPRMEQVWILVPLEI